MKLLTLIKDKYYYMMVFSQDENGWYGEVFDRQGKTVYTSSVYVTYNDACVDVQNWGSDHI